MEPSNIFSVDVEDWFHILELERTPDVQDWYLYPSHVTRNFIKLLELFSQYEVKVTCFFLGWVAQAFPELVREAARCGHEIACHGYAHVLCHKLTPPEFLADVTHAKGILEDILGKPVRGYRASGFSVTEATPWFFEKLAQAGFSYDSSVFPMRRAHGGLKGACRTPYVVKTVCGTLVEFPISVVQVWGGPMCFFGGGYFRLFPYWVIRRMTRQVMTEGRPVIFYVHPREIDPNHPRMPMTLLRSFKSYVNLKTTESKLHRLFNEFPMMTFEDYLSNSMLVDVA